MNITRYNVQSNIRDLTITTGTLDLSATGVILASLNSGGIWTAVKSATGAYRITFNQSFPAVAGKSIPIVYATIQAKGLVAPGGAPNAVPAQLDLTTNPKAPTLVILTLSPAGAPADPTTAGYLHFTILFSNTASP